MSRTQSQGIGYFPMAVDFFSDRKIKVLEARYGTAGVLLVIDIFCQIYREGFYTRVDDDFIYILSSDHNMSPDTVEQVLTFLLKRSMFNEQLFKSDAILTSTGIQERWQKAIATRASKTPIKVDARFWLLKKNETRPYIKVTDFCPSSEKKDYSSEKNDDTSEKKAHKEKESKRNKNIESSLHSLSTGARAGETAFVIPTADEVQAYCNDRGNGIDAEEFVAHYSSNGWMVGQVPMRDWKAAVRTWEIKRKNKLPDRQSSMDVIDRMLAEEYAKGEQGQC